MTISAHVGGGVYSNSEYDLYTGRLTREYTVVRKLRGGDIVRKHVQVLDPGRPDQVPPADIAMIAQGDTLPGNVHIARRDAWRVGLILSMVAAHPGMTTPQLCAATCISKPTMLRLLTDYGELMVCVERLHGGDGANGTSRKWYPRGK